MTNINSDGSLTLQLVGPGTTKLKEIEQKINSLCNKKELSAGMFVKKMSVGLQCVAKCSDNKYYRAKVTNILSRTEVEVNLVDYGKLVTVEKLKIRSINDSGVWSLPHQAVTCCLDNLPPPKGSWTQEAIDYLKHKCSDEVTVESMETLGMVRLYLQNSDDEEDINDTLQSSPHLFGLPWNHKTGEVDVDTKQTNDGCHGDNNSTYASDQLNTNRNSNVIFYQSSDDEGTKTIESSVTLQPDTFQFVKVTYISTTTDEFVVQLLSNENLMEKLDQELQHYCDNTVSSYSTINDLLHSNHFCAVKHDGKWYRGKVLNVKGQDILVTLLDYGPQIVTNINCIHHLHSSMVAIPAQAVLCRYYLSLKEGLVRPLEIIIGNRYHCFPYFQSKQCHVVCLVDCQTNTLLQSSS